MSTETAVSFEFKLFCFADIVYFDWYIFVYMYFLKVFLNYHGYTHIIYISVSEQDVLNILVIIVQGNS